MAYKADVADTRESPSLEVFKQLVARGGDVRYCDAHIPASNRRRAVHGGRRGPTRRSRRPTASCMLTQHREFLEHPRWDRAKVVVDTRNVVPAAPNVRRI